MFDKRFYLEVFELHFSFFWCLNTEFRELLLEHPHWWSHIFYLLATQKATLSILTSYFITLPISMVLYFLAFHLNNIFYPFFIPLLFFISFSHNKHKPHKPVKPINTSTITSHTSHTNHRPIKIQPTTATTPTTPRAYHWASRTYKARANT